MLIKKYLLTEKYNYKRFNCKTIKGPWRNIVCGKCIHRTKDNNCDIFDEHNTGFCGMSIVRKIFTKSYIKKLEEKSRGKRLTHFYSLEDSRDV